MDQGVSGFKGKGLMPKIVILGSCKYEPYEILIMPNKLDAELYEKDHERAYEEACKKFFPAIDEADEVWVYAPDGMGIHTTQDYSYARMEGKTIRFLAKVGHLNDIFFAKLFEKYSALSASEKEILQAKVRDMVTSLSSGGKD